MGKVTKKILKAVDALIEKYSKPMLIADGFYSQGIYACPLCLVCNNAKLSHNEWCQGCPNVYFYGEFLGCSNRSIRHPELNYQKEECYPALKQFWTKFKEAAESGKSSDESIKFALEHHSDE